jgi:metal-dependent amidase/aminoacylase/carboxypeptidase family protein
MCIVDDMSTPTYTHKGFTMTEERAGAILLAAHGRDTPPEYAPHTADEAIAHARDSLVLPDEHVVGGYPVEDYGDEESAAAFVALYSDPARPVLTLAEIDALPYTTAAARDDEATTCMHCGHDLVWSLDGVRGKLGHADTTDDTCANSPRALALVVYFGRLARA